LLIPTPVNPEGPTEPGGPGGPGGPEPMREVETLPTELEETTSGVINCSLATSWFLIVLFIS
jgi:hypothetical protein